MIFAGFITLLIAVVTINNNLVEAQWVETPPRYTCPTGNMHNDDITYNIYILAVHKYTQSNDIILFYQKQIEYCIHVIVLGREMMVLMLNVTIRTLLLYQWDYDR